jgi:hypothetical protein
MLDGVTVGQLGAPTGGVFAALNAFDKLAIVTG